VQVGTGRGREEGREGVNKGDVVCISVGNRHIRCLEWPSRLLTGASPSLFVPPPFWCFLQVPYAHPHLHHHRQEGTQQQMLHASLDVYISANSGDKWSGIGYMSESDRGEIWYRKHILA
jgi:hypothetical protein